MIGVAQGDRLIKLRASQLVVATGRLEQPLVFHNNDLPGVFLGSRLQRLMRLYSVRPGERALVVTAGDSGWAVAGDLLNYGVEVVMVVDARPEMPASAAAARVQAAGVAGMFSSTVLSARGRGRVEGALVAQINQAGLPILGTEAELECDLIGLSTGFVANNALLHQSGCRFDYDADSQDFVPSEYPPWVRGAGHAIATRGLAAIWLEGQVAGLEAGLSLEGFGDERARQQSEDWRGRLEELKANARAVSRGRPPADVPAGGKKKFVCLCEDVTVKDIQDAVAEGFDDIETLKRSTPSSSATMWRRSRPSSCTLSVPLKSTYGCALWTPAASLASSPLAGARGRHKEDELG